MRLLPTLPMLSVLLTVALTGCGNSELEARLQNKNTALEKQVSLQEKKLDRLEKEIDLGTQHQEELQSQVDQARTNSQQLAAQLEEAKQKATASSELESRLEKEIDIGIQHQKELLGQVEQARANGQQLAAQLEEARHKAKASSEQESQLEKEIARLQKEIELSTQQAQESRADRNEPDRQQLMAQLQEARQRAKANNLRYQEKLKALTASLAGVRDQITEPSRRAKQEKAARESVEKQLQAQVMLTEKENQRAETAIQRQQDLEKDKMALNEKLQALDLELANNRAQQQDLNANNKSLKNRMVQTGELLDQARNKATQLNSDYKSMVQKQQLLAKVNESHRSALESAHAKLQVSQAKVARLSGARGTYTVQPNDSLSSIAAFFYRDGNYWSRIWKANRYMLAKPDLIYTGMVLIIPQVEALNAKASS